MKKIALIVLSLFAFSAIAAFADDALVLPTGVFRVTTAFSYAMGDQQYDADGDEQDLDNGVDSISALNLGLALEYGINDWISAAIQWAPGYTVWSVLDGFAFGPFEPDANANGPNDIFAGAKLQIVGPKAPVANEMVRFAIAPGVKIPLGDPDWEKQLENILDESDATVTPSDKHAFGLGGRLYADYAVNEMFFINVYSEYIYYLERKDANIAPTTDEDASAVDIGFGYDLTLELEPHFQYMVSEGMRLGVALPVTYSMTPDVEVDGESVDDSATTLLQVGPNVALFFMKAAVPFELKLAYMLPLMGTNTTKLSTDRKSVV